VDFPDDLQAWDTEDQFMFGPDILVAPVLAEGVRERDVYLPVLGGAEGGAGLTWRDAWSGEEYDGATTVRAAAPLERIPVFLKAGSTVQL